MFKLLQDDRSQEGIGLGYFLWWSIYAGVSTLAIPFYPKRCIVCGKESSSKQSKPQYSESCETLDVASPRECVAPVSDTKKCAVCAETIKLEAIKCRFCGEQFDPAEVARQVAQARNADSFDNRVLCSDGSCIGVIGPNGRCKVCDKAYKPDEC